MTLPQFSFDRSYVNFLSAILVGLCCLIATSIVTAEVAKFTLLLEDGTPIQDAVVEIIVPEDQRSGIVTPGHFDIDQIDKEFVPELTVLVAGSEVGFPNSDHILHHVYSFSEIREFNIPLYGTGENDDFIQTFDVAGVAELGCNIHDWMLAYVYVAETDRVGRTGSDGVVSIEVDSGEHRFRVWHPRLPRRQRNFEETIEIQIGSGAEKEIRLNLMKDRRIRRAPAAGSNRYR